MATIRRAATVTIVDGWPTKVPNVSPELNIDDPVDTPNLADFVSAGQVGRIREQGGYDFSAIPVGSTINSITVRQHLRGITDAFDAGEKFVVKASGVVRGTLGFNVDTSGTDVTKQAVFGAVLTRDELAAGALSVELTTQGAGTDPPIPDG